MYTCGFKQNQPEQNKNFLDYEGVLSYIKNIWKLTGDDELIKLFKPAGGLILARTHTDFIQNVLDYIFKVHEHSPEKLKTMIDEYVGEGEGEVAMTTAMMLELKGEKRGKNRARKKKS